MPKNKQRVLVIEPSQIIFQGLKSIIDKSHEFVVVAGLSDFQYLGQRVSPLKADIIIFNPNLVSYHKRGNIRSVFQDLGNFVLIALHNGYVKEEFLNSFDAVIGLDDEPSKIINTLTNTAKTRLDISKPEQSELSDREKEILISIAKGMQNKEIAEEHNISVHTVISHRKNISRKTGIKSVSGLTIYALLNNLINKNEFI